MSVSVLSSHWMVVRESWFSCRRGNLRADLVASPASRLLPLFLLNLKPTDTSYSWSANVLGRKRWHFVAPSEIQYCRRDPDDRKSELLTDLREVDEDLFPHFHKAKIVTVEQEEGDVIFV